MTAINPTIASMKDGRRFLLQQEQRRILRQASTLGKTSDRLPVDLLLCSVAWLVLLEPAILQSGPGT